MLHFISEPPCQLDTRCSEEGHRTSLPIGYTDRLEAGQPLGWVCEAGAACGSRGCPALGWARCPLSLVCPWSVCLPFCREAGQAPLSRRLYSDATGPFVLLGIRERSNCCSQCRKGRTWDRLASGDAWVRLVGDPDSAPVTEVGPTGTNAPICRVAEGKHTPRWTREPPIRGPGGVDSVWVKYLKATAEGLEGAGCPGRGFAARGDPSRFPELSKQHHV